MELAALLVAHIATRRVADSFPDAAAQFRARPWQRVQGLGSPLAGHLEPSFTWPDVDFPIQGFSGLPTDTPDPLQPG